MLGIILFAKIINRKNIYFKDFNYLFLGRKEEKEKERERNINVWLPLACPLLWGPGPQPRHVP